MTNIIKILANNVQKIPSWKVDNVRNLDSLDSARPRKLRLSGNFHFKTTLTPEKSLCK